jgi:hypothetical protein
MKKVAIILAMIFTAGIVATGVVLAVFKGNPDGVILMIFGGIAFLAVATIENKTAEI